MPSSLQRRNKHSPDSEERKKWLSTISPQSALKSVRGVAGRDCAWNLFYVAAGVEHMQGQKTKTKTLF